MFRPSVSLGPKGRIASVLSAVFLITALAPAAYVAAATTVTPATGGSAISADNTAGGVYTSLTGPIFATTNSADIAAGNLVLTAPSGFTFQPSNGALALTGAGCGTLVHGTDAVFTSTATFGLSGTSGADCVLTVSGLKVLPNPGIPLASGNIVASGAITNANVGTLVEVSGITRSLTFTAVPTSAQAGVVFSPNPRIMGFDQFGNPATSDNTTPIGLMIATGTPTAGGPGTLACTSNTATLTGGVATFMNCSINTAGRNYQLYVFPTLLGSLVAPVSSAPFGVTGAPAAFVFTATPSSGSALAAFATQPVVQLVDAAGNVLTATPAFPVTLAITTGTGTAGAFLTCAANPVTTVSGVATFAGCTINLAGAGYTLRATGYPLLGGVAVIGTSTAFNVAGPAAALAVCFDVACVKRAPTYVVGGQPFGAGNAPIVYITDASGVPVSADNTTRVTLSLNTAAATAGANLTCTDGLTQTVVLGTTMFPGCSIDKAGVNFAIIATPQVGSVLTAGSSTLFAVGIGLPTRLTFTNSPNAATTGTAFIRTPTVAITDAGGNIVTSAVATSVTLTIMAGTGQSGAVLTCAGGTTVATTAGVATFTGCSIDRTGIAYSLTATAALGALYTPAYSNGFDVSLPPAWMNLQVASIPAVGGTATLSILVGGNGGANQPITFEKLAPTDTNWVQVGTTTTDASGYGVFSTPAVDLGTYYRAVFAGNATLGASISVIRQVQILPVATIVPRGPATGKAGTTHTYVVSVNPAGYGGDRVTVTFFLYQSINGVWVSKKAQTKTVTAAGTASWSVTWAKGKWYVRGRINPTNFTSQAWSPTSVFTAK